MPQPWIPDPKRTVKIVVEVEGEIEFPDDYPWDGDVYERLEYDMSGDPVGRFADACIRAIVENVEGPLVTAAMVSFETRHGTATTGAGMEPFE